MKVEFWLIGKTKESWINDATEHYLKRSSRYCTLTTELIPESRYTKPEEMRKDETDRVITRLRKASKAYTILLDEGGKQLTSIQFSELISKQQSAGMSTLRFIVGGAFGVERGLHNEVDYILSLSVMTFPHQLVRIIFLEQLYRAFTILRGEGYHHV
jgi:23S rRNA (pseudouridine1915-N3)-methyltransferase